MGRPGQLVVRPLRVEGSPTSVLRGLRGREGLVALIGDWCGGGAILAWGPAEVLPVDADPFDLPAPVRLNGGAAGFGGGWIGLWGYQLNRRLEAVPPPPPRPVPQPDHWLARYDWVLRYDANAAAWSFESVLEPDRAEALQGRVEASLAATPRLPEQYAFDPFVMEAGPATYRAAIATAREHIWAGDVFQANICTRFTSRLDGDPLDAFCDGVEALAPSYAAYLDTGDRQVVSLSPELFLRRDGREVVTRPIKGTAPAAQDPALLARSAKDRAENVMIVDLMRNDLGRVCEPGSVRVSSLARPERGAGVRHLVSEIRGTLPGDATDGDLLRATFPPGSVTGAPKVRAMEVIHELETTGRELYTGAIGYVSPGAGLEASVVIRTLEFQADACWVGIGCGIVADSDPDREIAEAYTKVEPLLAALGATLATAAPAVSEVPLPRDPPVPLTASNDDAPEVGHGVFETLAVRHGSAIDLTAHLDRLVDSVAALYADHPDRSRLEARVRREAAMRGGTARLRVTYSPEDRLVAQMGRPEARDAASDRGRSRRRRPPRRPAGPRARVRHRQCVRGPGRRGGDATPRRPDPPGRGASRNPRSPASTRDPGVRTRC